jgi:lipopolysaccharide biosynthesis protein
MAKENTLNISNTPNPTNTAKVAVVIHVHYVDTINLFAKAFKASPLKNTDFFFTLSPAATKSSSKIEKLFPGCTIDSFENKGRDILPFFLSLEKNKLLSRYDHILKLHGKKTVALPGYGAFWLIDTIQKLIPATKPDLSAITSTLDSSGLVGPAGQLFNYDAQNDKNHEGLLTIFKELRLNLEDKYSEYFFGGSMLWFSAKALSPLAETVFKLKPSFDEESGQLDATFAHSIERAFTIYNSNQAKALPTIANLSQGLIREMRPIDVSMDGLISSFEEFSNMEFIVANTGKTYTLNYKEMTKLQDLRVDANNIHLQLARAESELENIRAGTAYKIVSTLGTYKNRLKKQLPTGKR